MADFWKTIESHYFNVIDAPKITYLKQIAKYSQSSAGKLTSNSVVQNFVGLIDKIIKPEAFVVSDESHSNLLNKNNFVTGSYINVATYGNLMVMKNKKQEPCDTCIRSFEKLMNQKFNIKTSKFKTNTAVQNYLNKESKNLDKCLKMNNFGFCDNCLRISTGYHQVNFLSNNIKLSLDKIKTLNTRTKYLTGLIKKRCKAEDKVKLAINVSLEANLIKGYLFYYLLELEQKLLADNVFNIVGKAKNFLLIEFIRIQGVYIINLDELKSWNKYREASLFKMHKCGYKYFNPYYSYNVK